MQRLAFGSWDFAADLGFEAAPGLGLGDEGPDPGIEIGIPQRLATPVLQALLEAGALSQARLFRSLRHQLRLDQVFDQHPPPGRLRQRAQVGADLGLGKFQVAGHDLPAVDHRDDRFGGASLRPSH